jgi:hypothetical protein
MAAQRNRLREPPQPGSPGHAHWLPDSMPAPAMTVKPSDLWPPARPARRRPGSASRWSRHPPHRTHSHCPPRRRAPPPGQDTPAQANAPPVDPRHCARRGGPGRGRRDRPMITNTDHKAGLKNHLPRRRAYPGRSTCHPPGPPRRPRPQPLVSVAAAVFLLRRVAGRGQVGDDAAGAALGAARAGRDVAEPHARVAGDAQQHPGVAGQDTPARHPEEWSPFLENYC